MKRIIRPAYHLQCNVYATKRVCMYCTQQTLSWAWISNRIHYTAWYEIIYRFPNFNGVHFSGRGLVHATSHNLRQYWPKSMPPFDIARAQWVDGYAFREFDNLKISNRNDCFVPSKLTETYWIEMGCMCMCFSCWSPHSKHMIACQVGKSDVVYLFMTTTVIM